MILYELMSGSGYRPLARMLYRMEIAGTERIPKSGPCILIANHESVIDPWVLGLATPRAIHYMAKAELWGNALARTVMEGFGAFPVFRGSGDGAAMSRAGRLLADGEVLGIFPQGTCIPRRDRPYMRGAARLALATGTPVIPVALVATEQAWRPRRPKFGLPRIRVLVARPLEVARQRPTLVGARELTRRMEEAIAELRRPYGEPKHAWIEETS
ncbi:MAG: lysophospholipid acyltransferase family protein [Gaiellaceae bacterium]